MRSSYNGNGNSHVNGYAAPSSPVPRWMRCPEWLLLAETRVTFWSEQP